MCACAHLLTALYICTSIYIPTVIYTYRVLVLGVIVARHFSSPAASLLASRWARLRAALLRFALRLVRVLGVGASRVSMAASVAEPQLAAAVVDV